MTTSSPPADSVSEPTRVSASTSVSVPDSGTTPGVRTSPTTKTRWLLNCATPIATCGLTT